MAARSFPFVGVQAQHGVDHLWGFISWLCFVYSVSLAQPALQITLQDLTLRAVDSDVSTYATQVSTDRKDASIPFESSHHITAGECSGKYKKGASKKLSITKKTGRFGSGMIYHSNTLRNIGFS
jgi:hypothetical protein